MADTKWKYGQFNAIEQDKFARRIETNSNNSFADIRNAVRDSLYKRKLDLTGEYHGIVVAQVPDPLEGKKTDSLSFFDKLMGYLPGDDKRQILRVKVRVPEIDAMIPEPTGPDDYKTIGMHQTFEALVSEKIPATLEYGQAVVVSFYNASGIFKPMIKEALAGANRAVHNAISISAQAAYGGDEFVGPIPPGAGFIPTNHVGKTIVEVSPGIPFKPNRVRIHEGIPPIPQGSALLVNVPTRTGYRQQQLHVLVARRFESLQLAMETDIGATAHVQSGWRKHAWESREHYEKEMKKRYPDLTVKEAESWKAYVSPHESGMAVDFYIPAQTDSEVDIAPSQPDNANYGSETNSEQKKTKAYKWLKENAHKYGFTPYSKEAWHWEVLLPIESYKTGTERTSEYDITDYNTRITETSKANGTTTNNKNFSFE